MRIVPILLIAVSLLSFSTYVQNTDVNLKLLYDRHHWFQLRDEVARTNVPLFYRAAVEVAFNQPHAETDLKTAISSDIPVELVFEARELLIGFYFREGKYREALSQAKVMLAQRPSATDIGNMLPTLDVLSSFQDQSVVSAKPFAMPIDIEDENLVLPLKLNGSEAHYILDNGFSLSGISESEAKRLKLNLHDAKTNIDTMSGAAVNIRIAVADDLEVGGIHLKNVAFYVLPDSQPPFNHLAEGRRGILGLPVVLALNHFKWNPKDRTFVVLPASKKSEKTNSNLAFDGTSVFNQLNFRGEPLNCSLDMGAQNTVLYPSFAKAFPAVVEAGLPKSYTVTGVGGSAAIDSALLPSLTFQVGDRNVLLKPAHVLLKDNNSTTSWFTCNLGMDLLNQAHRGEVDFDSMTLLLR